MWIPIRILKSFLREDLIFGFRKLFYLWQKSWSFQQMKPTCWSHVNRYPCNSEISILVPHFFIARAISQSSEKHIWINRPISLRSEFKILLQLLFNCFPLSYLVVKISEKMASIFNNFAEGELFDFKIGLIKDY